MRGRMNAPPVRPDSRLVPSKRYVIEGLPVSGAFNGSTVHVGGRRLLAYRTPDATRSIGFAWLDEDFRTVPGSATLTGLTLNEDPRLLIAGDGRLFLTTGYCGSPGGNRIELRRLAVAEPHAVVEDAVIGKFDHVLGWPGYARRVEKNWAPFEAGGRLWYVYSLDPHRILGVDVRSGTVSLAYETEFARPSWWDERWGSDLRLTAPPARLAGGAFLSTWHASRDGGYWSGFYTFEGEPPFRVLRFAEAPAVTPADASGVNRQNPLAKRCVFVCGMELDEPGDEVVLTGGDNDHSLVAFRFRLADVLGDLRPREPGRAAVRRHGHTDVALVHATATPNIGDLSSAPSHYFDLGRAARQDLAPDLDLRGRNVVVGGGGLLGSGYGPRILNILRSRPRRLVLWGVGLNDAWRELPDWVSQCDLVGCRQTGLPVRWVPCASCRSTLFDLPNRAAHDYVYFLHFDAEPPPVRPGSPVMKNNVGTMREAVAFLGSGRTVVTNSYHGVYWATLLGRRVVMPEPMGDTATKFSRMRHPPAVLAPGEDLEAAAARAAPYSGALEECRRATQLFYQDVMDVLA